MWSPNELLKIEKQRDILSYITLQFFHFKKVPLEHCPLRAGAFWQYEKGVFQRLRHSEFSFLFCFSHSTSQGCSSYSLRRRSSISAFAFSKRRFRSSIFAYSASRSRPEARPFFFAAGKSAVKGGTVRQPRGLIDVVFRVELKKLYQKTLQTHHTYPLL